ncbi:hypothetical protein [Nocardia asteroides]|uniref:hypothetical protein n=1 Tax=Nocardia asteroides TaxID=1824 RepID=UPI0034418754
MIRRARAAGTGGGHAEEPRIYGGVSAAERSAARRERLLTAATAIWGESGMAAVTADDPHLHRILSSYPDAIGALAQRRQDALDTVAQLVVTYAPEALGVDLDPDQLRRTSLFITGGVNQIIEGWLSGSITLTAAELAAECAHMCIVVLQPQRTS